MQCVYICILILKNEFLKLEYMYFFVIVYFTSLKYCRFQRRKYSCGRWHLGGFLVQAKLRAAYVVNIAILKISNPGRVTSFIKPTLSSFYVIFEVQRYRDIEKCHYIIYMITSHPDDRRMYAWILALIKIIHCLSTSSNKVISSVPWYRFTLLCGQNRLCWRRVMRLNW